MGIEQTQRIHFLQARKARTQQTECLSSTDGLMIFSSFLCIAFKVLNIHILVLFITRVETYLPKFNSFCLIKSSIIT